MIPTEDPRYGAQVGESPLAGPARRTRADAAAFQSVDRSRLRVEAHESLGIDELRISLLTRRCQDFADLLDLGAYMRLAFFLHGKSGDAREKKFEIIGCGDEVGELLGNCFSLLGQADVALDGAVRKRPEEAVSRAGASADCSPTPVEETNFSPVCGSGRSDRGLRLVERPLAGENPAVLVAVAVADHHLLHGPGSVGGRAPLRGRSGDRPGCVS